MLHVSLCRFFFFLMNELLSMPQLNNYGGTAIHRLYICAVCFKCSEFITATVFFVFLHPDF